MSDDNKTEKLSFEERVFEEFRNVNTQLAALDTRLTSLETKVDERLRETRPMLDQILKVMNDRFDVVDEHLDRLDDLQNVLANRDVAQDADIAKLRRRLDRIENNPNAPTERLK